MSDNFSAPPARARAVNVAKVVCFIIIACCLVWFCYGLIYFIDAPFRPCGVDQFCGKTGRIHTSDEYRAFIQWQTVLMCIWPFCFLAAYVLERARRKAQIKDK